MDKDLISSHIKSPFFVFYSINVIDNREVILFVTADAQKMFDCIRFHMTNMCVALINKALTEFGFKTVMMSPLEVEALALDINTRAKALETQKINAVNSAEANKNSEEDVTGKILLFMTRKQKIAKNIEKNKKG